MILTYALVALMIGAITLLARGSARRLIVAGATGLIVTFLMLPWAAVTGAFSRHLVSPTPIAFSATLPFLWLAPILAVVLLWVSRRQQRFGGPLGLGLGVLTLLTAWLSWNQPERIVRIGGVGGVLELLIPLGAFLIAALLARGLPPKLTLPATALAALLAVALGAYLFNPSAALTFDALRGYYKAVTLPSPQDLAQVVSEWNNDDLAFNNKERQRINQEWQNLKKQATATLEPSDQLDLDRKTEQLRLQRAQYGLSDDQTELEFLKPISTASELPRGYSVGRNASDAGIRRLQAQRVAYGFGAWVLFGVLLICGGAGLLLRHDALEQSDFSSGLVFAAVATTLAFGFNAVEFDLGRLLRGWPFIQDFLDRATPPDFQAIASDVLKSLAITVATAMIGTVIAAVLALPSSLLAARNLTQKSSIGRVAYVLTRVFFNIDRGVDTLILALILVAAVGLGPLAGVIAMGVHSMADLGKLYSEAIENADKGPIEALEAAGAPGTSVVRWAVLPQVMPLFVSYTLYRFEINFRVSIILGFVGAGGIGFLIQETMRSGKYAQMVVAVLAVVVMVNVLDFVSASVRRRIIG